MRLVHSTPTRDLARLIAIRTRKEYHRASARLPPFRTGDGIPRGMAAASRVGRVLALPGDLLNTVGLIASVASRRLLAFFPALADALVLFTDPRGRKAPELTLTASRMSALNLPRTLQFQWLATDVESRRLGQAGFCVPSLHRKFPFLARRRSWFDDRVVGHQFVPECLHHPVSANRTFPIRRQIGPFCGDFRPLTSPDFGLCGCLRISVAIFGALSPHPKNPFPAAGLKREVRPRLEPSIPTLGYRNSGSWPGAAAIPD
jgi:hypothetical protein